MREGPKRMSPEYLFEKREEVLRRVLDTLGRSKMSCERAEIARAHERSPRKDLVRRGREKSRDAVVRAAGLRRSQKKVQKDDIRERPKKRAVREEFCRGRRERS